VSKNPNIILFITHDQGQYLGCYDSTQTPNSLKTPNLDKLAKNGVRFTNFFCTAPQCSPSRGGIQTSLYPHQNGLMGLVDRGWTLPETNKTLPMYLKENGYSTHLLGLQHETFNAKSVGYDTISKRGPEFKYSCRKMEDTYFEFIAEHAKDTRPFYACIDTIEVHLPFHAWAQPLNPDKVKVPPFLPDHQSVRKNLAEFYGVIQHVDNTVGKINDYLEDKGLKEDTLFIYTTDHGLPFPRAKCTLYDPGIKTLLLMSLPQSDAFSGGKVINQMISNIDLLPTLIDYIGGKELEGIEGRNFMPIMTESNEKFRTEIFTEKTYHEIYDPIRAVRTEQFKYIFNFEVSNTLYQIPLDIMREPSGQLIKESYNKPRPKEEFYDLKKDPDEQNNLIENYNYQDVILELKAKLKNWMKQTKDPILNGKVEDQRKEQPRKY